MSSLRQSSALAAAAAAAVAPVTVRNVVVGGELALISVNGGVTFAMGNSRASFHAGGGMGRLPGISGDIRVQREESRRAAERAACTRTGRCCSAWCCSSSSC